MISDSMIYLANKVYLVLRNDLIYIFCLSFDTFNNVIFKGIPAFVFMIRAHTFQ